MIFLTLTYESIDKLESLMEELRQGDMQAIADIYEITHGAVYALALSMLKNAHDAQDVLHDTYVNLHCAAASYKAQKRPMAYIMAIARNLCLMKLRERKKTAEPFEDWLDYIESNNSVTPQDEAIIRLCMEKLTDQEREIVILHASAGFKHREIASMLDLPLPTVLSKYHRALKKLRDMLERG
ncbi:MAG: RNA polymerase sigma factor [Clostridiales bacterium]|nr:RNA polymerase sigma factor [Clostridiales bacterium]